MAQQVTDTSTSVSMSLSKSFWAGSKMRALGIGPRVRKIAFVAVKIYSIALYVEEEAARADLAGKLGSDDAVSKALAAGPYAKAFQLHLLRDVTGAQFVEAFGEALKPRMQGDTAPLAAFNAYFQDKPLPNGTNVVLLWRQPATLDLLTCPPGSPMEDFSQAQAGTSIDSARLCSALFDGFLDAATPAPEARKAWIQGAKALAA